MPKAVSKKKKSLLKKKNRLTLIISICVLALILLGVITYQWILNQKDMGTNTSTTNMTIDKWINDNILKNKESEDTTTNTEDTETPSETDIEETNRIVKEYTYTSTSGDSMKVLIVPDSSDTSKYYVRLQNITKNNTKKVITMYGDDVNAMISPTINYILVYDDPPAEAPIAVHVFDENGKNLYSNDTDKDIWEYIYDHSSIVQGMNGNLVKGWVNSNTCSFEMSDENTTVTALLHIPTLKMEIKK